MKMSTNGLGVSCVAAVVLLVAGVSSAHATVIIDETWVGGAGDPPSTVSWDYTSAVTLDGAGNVTLDTSGAPQQLLAKASGPGSQMYAPTVTEFARLTINDMVPDYNSYFGLEGYGTRVIVRSDLGTGFMHVDINNSSTFTHMQTTLSRWANGKWVINWYTDRVTISNNGTIFFDSNVDLPTTGDPGWSIPTDVMRPNFYFAGAANAASLGQVTWESLPVPEPASLVLVGLSAVMMLTRRRGVAAR